MRRRARARMLRRAKIIVFLPLAVIVAAAARIYSELRHVPRYVRWDMRREIEDAKENWK